MSEEDYHQMGFQIGNQSVPNSGGATTMSSMSDKVAGISMNNSISMFKSSSNGGGGGGGGGGVGVDPFFASNWDHHQVMTQTGNFPHNQFSNSPYLMDTQGITSSSHFSHYPHDSTFVEMPPKMPGFGSGSFSEMVGSFGLHDCGQISNNGQSPNLGSGKERVSTNWAQSQEDRQMSEETAMGTSSNGKRKKRELESNSPVEPNKNVEGEPLKDGESSDEKKPKTDQNSGSSLRGKQVAKQGKDNSNSEEAPKDNYIHVRARRGQATNSHSLAERVRREKISERMRLLQELVPGCNKITGKAVMLDEIINYVQSLQQQVEFLSMKLATVNPELNIDIDRILSKDILHSRGGNPAIFGFNPGMNPVHHYPHGLLQGSIPNIPSTNTQFPSMPHQTVLDNELQNLYHVGFESSSALDGLGPNGRLKP
ncbi:hypothetical protein ACFE04_006252 [Oxalis oulophora]